MPRTPTTPAQIDGHRFLMRRIEHALVRADAKMLHDPLRTRNRAAVIGFVLVVVLGAGTAIMGLIRPQSADTMRSEIVTAADSHTMYVRLNEQLHPVANLASARLVVGSAEVPQKVSPKVLEDAGIGYPIGISGAPAVVDKQSVASVTLGVCDRASTSLHQPMAVVDTVARLQVGYGPSAGGTETSLVAEFKGEHWVVHDGVRARVNVADPIITRALGITPESIRPVSEAFLGAVPEASVIGLPTIPGRGEPTGFPSPFDQVGAVIEVGDKSVVAVRGGAAEVSPVLAEMLRAVGPQYSATARELAAVPVASPITVTGMPRRVPKWNSEDGWVCADSTSGSASGAGTATVVNLDHVRKAQPGGIAFPAGHVTLFPHADGQGPLVDGFVGSPSSATIAVLVDGAPHLISSSGIRYKVESRRALAAMGFESEDALPALPWRVVVALREGPELTHRAALSPVDSAG